MIDWEQIRINAAISAMQGVLESGKLGMVLEAAPDVVAKQSVKLADALVEELKKRTSSSDLTEEVRNVFKRKSPEG